VAILIMPWLVRIPFMMPNKKLKIIWDLFYAILYLYRIFMTSIKIAFFCNNLLGAFKLIGIQTNILLNICFVVDIILNLRTGFYDKGLV
jgi:hypothetical protein